MIVEKLIERFDESINETDILWYSSILQAIEKNLQTGEDVKIINKKVGTSKFTVSITKEDLPLAIAQCENFFKCDSIMLNRVSSVKDKILKQYG